MAYDLYLIGPEGLLIDGNNEFCIIESKQQYSPTIDRQMCVFKQTVTFDVDLDILKELFPN